MSAARTGLQQYCRLERQLLENKLKLLTDLEAAVGEINIEADIQGFIRMEKASEFTHKYSKAMDLMDWDFDRR